MEEEIERDLDSKIERRVGKVLCAQAQDAEQERRVAESQGKVCVRVCVCACVRYVEWPVSCILFTPLPDAHPLSLLLCVINVCLYVYVYVYVFMFVYLSLSLSLSVSAYAQSC